MAVDDKRLLTDEIAWRDLQEIKFQNQGGTMGIVILQMLLVFGIFGCIVVSIATISVYPWLIILFLSLAVFFAYLIYRCYRYQIQCRDKALSAPLNTDLLIYDWDVCIKKVFGTNDDPDILVFGNPSKEVCSDCNRYPWFHATEVDDTFIVVRLQGHPKVFKYYPTTHWHIGESEEDNS